MAGRAGRAAREDGCNAVEHSLDSRKCGRHALESFGQGVSKTQACCSKSAIAYVVRGTVLISAQFQNCKAGGAEQQRGRDKGAGHQMQPSQLSSSTMDSTRKGTGWLASNYSSAPLASSGYGAVLPHSLMAFSLNSSGVPGGVQLFPVTQCLHGEGDGEGDDERAAGRECSTVPNGSRLKPTCSVWHRRGKCCSCS